MLVHPSWDSEADTQVVTVSGILREAAAAGLFLALQLLFRCLLLPPCFWPSVITPERMFSWVAFRCFLLPSCAMLLILMDIIILTVWYLVKKYLCLCESKFEGTFMRLLSMFLLSRWNSPSVSGATIPAFTELALTTLVIYGTYLLPIHLPVLNSVLLWPLGSSTQWVGDNTGILVSSPERRPTS